MKTFLSLAIVAALFGFFACNSLAATSPSLFAETSN